MKCCSLILIKNKIKIYFLNEIHFNKIQPLKQKSVQSCTDMDIWHPINNIRLASCMNAYQQLKIQRFGNTEQLNHRQCERDMKRCEYSGRMLF